MGIVGRCLGLISEKYQVDYTQQKALLTKHGPFQAKMYRHAEQEYLVIMSTNFESIETPIFYIHSNTHACNALDDFCGCGYPISVALKMIQKEGGFLLYTSQDHSDIDRLLEEIGANTMVSDTQILHDVHLGAVMKGYRGEYLTIDFILKELKIQKVLLITDNANILFIVEQRNIQILNHTATIGFSYGESIPVSRSDTIARLNQYIFDYEEAR